MIVTTVVDGSSVISDAGYDRRQRCLARRGMLHSECEAIDHVRVRARGELELAGGGSQESAWFVLSGRAVLDADAARPVGPGDLILVPASCVVRFHAADEDLELLWIAVLPAALSRALPARRPAVR